VAFARSGWLRDVGPCLRGILGMVFCVMSLAAKVGQGQESTPSSPNVEGSAALAVARQFIRQGEWARAEGQLRNALQANNKTAEVRYLLGYVLLRENRALDSLAAYTVAAASREPTSEDLNAIASDYVLLKAYTDAEHWLLMAVRQSPENRQSWYLLGRTQYNLDHAADAAASFQRCLALSPGDPRAEYNLGLADEKLQKPDEARAAYQQAIRWQTEQGIQDAQPYLDLGMLSLSQGRAQDALPLLTEATRLSPGNPLIFQELGLSLDALGRSAEAVESLRKATELAPDAERPHFFLGRIYRRNGQKEKSDEQFAIVQRLLGTHSDTATPNVDRKR